MQLCGSGDDQVLIIGGQFGFRAGHIQRRHGADFQLFLVIVVEFFRDRNSLLLHVHVKPGIDQFPISVDGVGDGGDGLLSKSQVGDLAIVPGNKNIAAVGEEAETVEQLLGNGQIKRRLNGGVEEVKRTGRAAGVIPGQVYRRARRKSL